MSQQLVIPDLAHCPNCGLDAKTSKSVYELFGVRLLKDSIETQSHCKNCRRQVLKGKFKDVFNQYKEGMKKLLHEETQKVLEQSEPVLIEIRKRHKEQLEKEWNKEKEKQKSAKLEIQAMIDKKIIDRRNALLKESLKP